MTAPAKSNHRGVILRPLKNGLFRSEVRMKYPNIETERKLNGYKRSEIARALGIERDTYNAWIDGEYPIPAIFLKTLCSLFRCSADYLLAPDGRYARWKGYRCLNDFEKGVFNDC